MLENFEGIATIKRIINEDDPLVLADKHTQHHLWDPSRDSLYLGNDVLQQLDYLKSNEALNTPEVRNYLLNPIRSQLANRFFQPKFRRHIDTLFPSRSGTPDTEIQTPTSGLIMDIAEFTDLFQPDRITDDELEAFLCSHNESLQAVEAKLLDELPQLQSQFEEKFTQAIDRHAIPFTWERYQQKREFLNIRLIDHLHRNSLGNPYYDSASELIVFPQTELTDKDMMLAIYTHEMTHLLAGKQYITEYQELYDRNKQTQTLTSSVKIATLRNGFLIGKRQFTWLNEAITETIAQEILKTNAELAYPLQRELYSLILSESDKQDELQSLFYKAYAEDIPAESNGRTPARSALHAAIREAYGPGFIPQVDRIIKEYGIPTAIHLMQSDWRKVEASRKNGVFRKPQQISGDVPVQATLFDTTVFKKGLPLRGQQSQ